MKTRITELFGIEYPIICGGMLWLATPELCAAISNAGGLGNITACNYDTGEELRQAIQRARELTSKPIGVNITLMPSMRFTDEIFDDFFKVCAEEKVEVIEVSGRPAVKYLDMLHKAGVKVMHKVGAVRHAKNIERYGYDAVIAAGIEEGGHPSMMTLPPWCWCPALWKVSAYQLLLQAELPMAADWRQLWHWGQRVC